MQVTQTLSEEQRKEMTPLKLRRKARDFALKTINSQRLGFQRYSPQLQLSVGSLRSVLHWTLLHGREHV